MFTFLAMVSGSADVALGAVVNLVHPHNTANHRVLNVPLSFAVMDIDEKYDDCYIHLVTDEAISVDATTIAPAAIERIVEVVPSGGSLFVYTNADPNIATLYLVASQAPGPSLDSIAPQTAEWSDSELSISPSNSGGNTSLTYSYTVNPSYPGISFNPATGRIALTPNSAAVLNFEITATTTDGSDSVAFTLTIADTIPPTVILI